MAEGEAKATPSSSSGGKKVRVLGLHGGGSNINVMKFQTSPLQRALGKDVEWDFMNGGRPWQHSDQVPGILVSLSKGMPFFGWYGVIPHDDSDRPYNEKLFDLSVDFTYEKVEEAVDRVLKHIEEEGPFDALVGFSQGCIVTHLVTATLRERGQEVPWKVNILFNGMKVRDPRYKELFNTPLKQPAIMVFGKQDEFYDYGKNSQVAMYEDPMILEHEEGHKFPTAKPHAQEIYTTIAEEVQRLCRL